jgi:hypothetical protein
MKLDDLIAQVHGEEPLDRLASAMSVKADLDDLTDSLIGHFVDQARRAGCSWSEIGAAMGVTKQAAQQRHTSERPPKRDRGFRLPVFTRFTGRARTAVREAEEAARALHHSALGTEHLLLGILAVPESLAAKVLADIGVERDGLLAMLERGTTSDERRRRVPFTPLAKSVIEGSLGEALKLGHNYVGTEHLLLAMFREPDSVAAKHLAYSGATHARVLTDVLERIRQAS